MVTNVPSAPFLRSLVSQAWEEVEIRDRVLTVLSQHPQLTQKAKKALRLCRKDDRQLRLAGFGKFQDEADVTVTLFIIAQADGELFLIRLRDFERAIDNFLHERKTQH
jgi:hypothetical protein